jgi:hypothetical protein
MSETLKYTQPRRGPKEPVEIVDEAPIAQALEDASPTARALQSGIAGNRINEPSPPFNQTPSEYIIQNERNAWIVLGVDRNSTKTTGYGGKGHTQCAAIDLVAGRMASYIRETDDEGALIYTNPDFKVDAARIYISQKADIDDYFDLTKGSVGKSKSRSAIGIKADDVRLISRNGIKLVTGTDTRDSQGNRIVGTKGIDLIAGNKGGLQPLVKGKNLVECFKSLERQVEQLRDVVESFAKIQNNFNQVVMNHKHLSNFPWSNGGMTDNSPTVRQAGIINGIQHNAQVTVSVESLRTNLSTWSTDYLNPTKITFINSALNKTN